MSELLNGVIADPLPPAITVLIRISAAMLLGALVALVYKRTRPAAAIAPSFTATLVLLAILIAMVTQVIGDNVARAFSLVGALSIVRFRTVVRDTQDTAYVIFSVGVGMAAGAGQYWVALAGLAVATVAAFFMRRRPGSGPAQDLPFELHVRVGIGHDPRLAVARVLDVHAAQCHLLAMETAQKGLSMEATYRVMLKTEDTADALVRALNGSEGVQAVMLRRLTVEDEHASWRAS